MSCPEISDGPGEERLRLEVGWHTERITLRCYAAVPEWIEIVFGVDPDYGNRLDEWLIMELRRYPLSSLSSRPRRIGGAFGHSARQRTMTEKLISLRLRPAMPRIAPHFAREPPLSRRVRRLTDTSRRMSAGFCRDRPGITPYHKEGRKYRVSLALISQRPSEFAPSPVKCGTIFRATAGNDLDQRCVATGAAGRLTGIGWRACPSMCTQEAAEYVTLGARFGNTAWPR